MGGRKGLILYKSKYGIARGRRRRGRHGTKQQIAIRDLESEQAIENDRKEKKKLKERVRQERQGEGVRM